MAGTVYEARIGMDRQGRSFETIASALGVNAVGTVATIVVSPPLQQVHPAFLEAVLGRSRGVRLEVVHANNGVTVLLGEVAIEGWDGGDRQDLFLMAGRVEHLANHPEDAALMLAQDPYGHQR